ncbi:CCR4-NOT transcription complex subunit 6-like-B [Echria macrotheca]|uniref:CCR4-NOT transcription complex subunit 6-like-B n=1 Tax=Echria macrotheca TaxID=438768 RepID=A0AAJ0B4F9_9PEZI|nr:CCR4-NOT transcription complex subunit 6-like-B [Echria macrotheca]
MDEEPTLPRLPGPPHRASAIGGYGRKRGRGPLAPAATAACFSTSSDPAVFSSDDDPALDNYIHGRRKKRYVGSWYDQQPASSDSALGDDTRSIPLPKPKRQLRRQLDSGVWLSQGDEIDPDDVLDEVIELDSPRPRLLLPGGTMAPPPQPTNFRYPAEEERAIEIIEDCIESGKEMVDLTHLNLVTISDATLEPINRITRIPIVGEDIPFVPGEPEIKLYLGANFLRRFPDGVFNIANLTELSLRGNFLRELPRSIASLKNLRVLSLVINQLRYMPGEFLDLLREGGKLSEVRLHPNPFYQLKAREFCDFGAVEYQQKTFPPLEPLERPAHWAGMVTTLRARTPVQYFEPTGAVRSDFQIPEPNQSLSADDRLLDHEDFWELAGPKTYRWDKQPQTGSDGEDDQQHGAAGPRTLFELAMNTLARHPDTERTMDLLSEKGMPEHFMQAFERAYRGHKMGGLRCCVCQREMLSPATQWIEFRHVHRQELTPLSIASAIFLALKLSKEPLVPFLRQGCSWKCVPHKAAAPTEPPRRVSVASE